MVGNPNCGKTSLFNALTGSNQKVGNYPGVTVERCSAPIHLGDTVAELVDVPGLYSLAANSEDERVATDVIQGKTEQPDLLLCVLDALHLERNLFFFSQLADQGFPMVVAVTMGDLLQRRGSKLDTARLAQLLGVEVIEVVGHKKQGLAELREALARNLEHPRSPSCEVGFPLELETKVAVLSERLARIGMDVSKTEVRHALLNPESPLVASLQDLPEILAYVAAAREEVSHLPEIGPSFDLEKRYAWAGMVAKAVTSQGVQHRSRTDRIDALLTHRVLGLAVFVGVMYVVFQSIYTFAGPLMELIEGAFAWMGERVQPLVSGHPVLESLVIDGLIAGVGGVVVFLPQILILFFFISVLEGSGYLARAAFLMDRLLGWAGLNGRAFIPLLSSFACAIPGIMAARVMPDPKARLATILIAPLMSCSARLPVYVLLIGAFIEPQFGAFWAGFALFAMHFLGLLVAIPVVYVLNRRVLRGTRLPFVLELPPYQLPKWRDVWLAMYFRGKLFLKTAGTIIVAMSLVIWALSYFPRSEADVARYEASFDAAAHSEATDEELAAARDQHVQSELLRHSYLGRFGRAIEPVFTPIGFDWRISTGILAAFPAREVVVPSLGILFGLGGDADEESSDLRHAIQQATWPDGSRLVTPYTAVGLMVFFALCCQCMATLAAVKRETNSWKWPTFMFVYMTALAYLGAWLVHLVGIVSGGA